jgi:hypothetical protein
MGIDEGSRGGKMVTSLLVAVSLAWTAGSTSVRATVMNSPVEDRDQSPSPPSSVGVPAHVVAVCREAIAALARAHGAIQVEAVSAGRSGQLPNGETTAPLDVRIIYQRGDEIAVRRARVACRVGDQGTVVALVAAEAPSDRADESVPALRPAHRELPPPAVGTGNGARADARERRRIVRPRIDGPPRRARARSDDTE